ncbi:SDR family NAD(P)-dependent oxidoreductase [Rhizobium sp. 25PS6]|uniref:SDR family NAD(P)-dependent oxidoreductase n=1 Tax=Rhizobium TaxID=379 RepID=UPI0014411158|nr:MULTISPECIES: SDR family NAD(P)-dependent oxidoreductase [Rhizobium]MBY3184616.1 SDR family NAD(P)-dependent oxidoreductase [Rhizobium laguerreae]MDU0310829.1 SDR family NAD(P)-dependent oxidoreductase [Rhizobium sp. 10PS4]MDU0360700.1 SDR family NAD(P)-dependent oxidoreductase [Rhizobium sp. 25PS6]NKM28823.1 SDR family NAD(P)-dependent oxidoreductase [Rhizobium laguerreae]
MSKQVIVITGASSGFGALTARALAKAGHTVYAGMRATEGRNAPAVADASVVSGIAKIIVEAGRLHVIIHNAGHMSFGPAEAFTPEQFAELFDINVLSSQRVNRAALPYLRKQGKRLVVWVSSSSSRGGTPPYLSPYFAAKAAMDSLAVSYAGELTRWGIETSIIVPGAFTKGTNFAHSGSPADTARAAEYNEGPYKGVPEQALQGLAALEPADADAGAVAAAIVDVVGKPFGTRPFRVHIDPSEDGAEIVNGVADRVRAELFRSIGLEDLLKPAVGN